MGVKKNNIQLAEEACEIEINRIKKPIGKQDQYACAIGDVNLITYHSSGLVSCKNKSNIKKFINEIMASSLFVWTGISRKSEIILKSQNLDIKTKLLENEMLKIKNICKNVYDEISNYNGKNFKYLKNFFIDNLNDTWHIKRSLHKDMTNLQIKKIIKIINSHCKSKIGIKLLGAGAGGFIMVTGIQNTQLLKKNLMKKKILSFETSIDKKGSIYL